MTGSVRTISVALLCAGLAACATAPRPAPTVATAPVVQAPRAAVPARDCSWYRPAEEDLSKRGDYVAGGLYRPGEKDRVPTSIPDVDCIPEPQVVALPRSKVGNRPVYSVLDREYRVLGDARGFAEEGLASYYGEKFHGRRTSNLEVYDMYAFTAAHKTLPLPSFARVTNLDNGRSVVVRVNDRGPFHEGRVMDLSLAAAVKLGVYPRGTGRVRVEALAPGDAGSTTTVASNAAPAASGVHVPSTQGAPPVTIVGGNGYRYDMRSADGQPNAQGFEDWMQQRGVRVATGRPTPMGTAAAGGAIAANASTSTTNSMPAQVDTAGAIAAPVPLPATSVKSASIAPTPMDAYAPRAPSTPLAGATPPASDVIVLQLASFATRDNADRAVAALQDAGVAQARLVEAVADSRTIWRLRVGPVPAATEPALRAQLQGLGYPAPQPVRD